MGRKPSERRGPEWKNSWQAALLSAAILSSCFLLTQVQEIPVRMEPSQPLEGGDVTLIPEGEPNFLACIWYRGEEVEPNRILTYNPSTGQQNGPNITGRETGGPDCSLRIMPLMLSDAGDYVLSRILMTGYSDKGRAHLQVLENLSPPILWPTRVLVEKHANVILNCTTSEGPGVTVSWLKDGRPVPAKAVPSRQSRTLTISDISSDEEGLYTCVAGNRRRTVTSNPAAIVVGQVHSTSSAGIISAIVLGSLALASAGILLFCFFRTRNQKRSKQMNPTSPVYENTCPSAPVRPRVVPETPSVISNTYEELQHGSQAVYDQLKW